MTFENQEAKAEEQHDQEKDVQLYIESLESTIQQRNQLLNEQFMKYSERENQQTQMIHELQSEVESVQKDKETMLDQMSLLQNQHKDGLEIIKNQSMTMLRHEDEHLMSKSQLSQMQARVYEL